MINNCSSGLYWLRFILACFCPRLSWRPCKLRNWPEDIPRWERNCPAQQWSTILSCDLRRRPNWTICNSPKS